MVTLLANLKWPALLLAAFFVSGCGASLAERMQSWVGTNESELLSRWGAPDASLRTDDGKKILTWKNVRNDRRGNLYTCRRSFTIGSDGKVERWAYDGC